MSINNDNRENNNNDILLRFTGIIGENHYGFNELLQMENNIVSSNIIKMISNKISRDENICIIINIDFDENNNLDVIFYFRGSFYIKKNFNLRNLLKLNFVFFDLKHLYDASNCKNIVDTFNVDKLNETIIQLINTKCIEQHTGNEILTKYISFKLKKIEDLTINESNNITFIIAIFLINEQPHCLCLNKENPTVLDIKHINFILKTTNVIKYDN
jgi:hypothetical protein